MHKLFWKGARLVVGLFSTVALLTLTAISFSYWSYLDTMNWITLWFGVGTASVVGALMNLALLVVLVWGTVMVAASILYFGVRKWFVAIFAGFAGYAVFLGVRWLLKEYFLTDPLFHLFGGLTIVNSIVGLMFAFGYRKKVEPDPLITLAPVFE